VAEAEKGVRAIRLEHAAIRVPELDTALAYYCGALGLTEKSRSNGTIYLGCGGDAAFDLSITKGGVGLDHLALSVGSIRELDHADRALNASGVRTSRTEGTEPGIRQAMRFDIPTGHEIELVVLAEPLGYVHPTMWNRDAIYSPVDINHVTLMCEDVRAAADFLVQTLNFHLSDVVEPAPGIWGSAFLRLGENHHDVALLSSRRNCLHHVAFQVTDISAMLGFCDRLVRLGYQCEYGIGRHGPGGNIFLYILDPAGNRIELVCDVPRVPDPNAPTRMWQGEALSNINVWAPIPPPESFRSGT
jgi:catechol 2,3-dioxygenase